MKKLLHYFLVCTLFYNVSNADTNQSQFNARLQKMERDFLILQKELYKSDGKKLSSVIQDDSGDHESRLLSIEEQMRDLYGKIEELDFQNRRTQEKLDMLNNDIEIRFKQLNSEGNKISSLSEATQPQIKNDVEASASENNTKTNNTLMQQNSKQKNVNKDLSDEKPLNKQISQQKNNDPIKKQDIQPIASPNEEEATKNTANNQKQDMYNNALSLIKNSKYDDALEVLNAFIKQYGNDPMVGNAYYWAGEVYYTKKLYEKAAIQYLRGFKSFPKGKKAPDTLLKASMSLSRLKKIDDSCNYLRRMMNLFPDMSPSLKTKADQEYNRLSCDKH